MREWKRGARRLVSRINIGEGTSQHRKPTERCRGENHHVHVSVVWLRAGEAIVPRLRRMPLFAVNVETAKPSKNSSPTMDILARPRRTDRVCTHARKRESTPTVIPIGLWHVRNSRRDVVSVKTPHIRQH